RFADLRTQYGATSTIFTEYLRAAGMEPSQRLATALLYGIKSDTLFLERGSQIADLEAFTFLYPFASRAMITRMERPALPREDLEALGRALSRLQADDGVAVIHMGEVKREDVIPQMAEFCLHGSSTRSAAPAAIVPWLRRSFPWSVLKNGAAR
ncbi:MAG: hypothetical protein HYY81_01515, partial [Deltaproteobacteria bacterium]|nr:hypothetical protein [Deltaproteobacteria bacterium]